MKFPDFSSFFPKFPDWKMLSHFSRFSSPTGNRALILSFHGTIFFLFFIFFHDTGRERLIRTRLIRSST